MANNKNELSIDLDLEPYHRRWSNGGFHTLSNRIGGAYSPTKKEWHRMVEAQNRANKLRKMKQKTGR